MLLPWLLGGAVGLCWALQSDRLIWPHGLGLLLWLLSGVLLLRDLRRATHGILHWDGQEWVWESAGRSVVGWAEMRLDFQSWLLLMFQPQDGPVQWLWPQRAADPLNWDALRRALCARGRPGRNGQAAADSGSQA